MKSWPVYLITAVAIVALFLYGGASDASPKRANRVDACAMSQEFVSRNLRAPATAVYPDWTEANCKATRDGDIWTVRSYVDSQNGFGALIRSNYITEMVYHPDKDSWTLVDIALR